MRKQPHNLFIFSSKENRSFFAKTLLMLAFLLLFCLVWIPHQYQFEYMASLSDKIDRLTSINGPKIVLIGNSNLNFGMRSELLEQAFGMPVVNMGFHGGAGNIFHENMVKMNTVPGDIYIICHSSYADNSSRPGNMPEVMGALLLDRRTWPLLFGEALGSEDKALLIQMVKAYPGYIKTGTRAGLTAIFYKLGLYDSIYLRSSFNEYGDIDRERAGTQLTAESFQNPDKPELGPETAARINVLNQWLAARGATLLVAGYPIPNGEYTRPKAEYEALQKDMEEKLDCPMISNLCDYMYGYEYFYNAVLHLNDAGATLRTEQLIKDLRGWMEQTGYRVA